MELIVQILKQLPPFWPRLAVLIAFAFLLPVVVAALVVTARLQG